MVRRLRHLPPLPVARMESRGGFAMPRHTQVIMLFVVITIMFLLLACADTGESQSMCERASANKAIEFHQRHPTCVQIACHCGQCRCEEWTETVDYYAD